MKTKAAAFHSWLEAASGLDVYAASSVSETAQTPYATYQWVEGSWGDDDVIIVVNLWFRTESEAIPNKYVSKLGSAIGFSGVLLECEGGALWVKRGSPWAQSVIDTDSAVRRRYLNLNIQTITN